MTISFAFTSTEPSQQDSQIDESTPFVSSADGDLLLLQESLQKLNLPPSCQDGNGLTPIHSAASYNQIDVLIWLISQEGVDINAKDNDGDTPLHYCDCLDAAKVLVEEGKADFKIRNEEGKTALETKQEELKDTDDEEDSDDEDRISLKALVNYLKEVSGIPGDMQQ
jgi:ankyrin repeat protein